MCQVLWYAVGSWWYDEKDETLMSVRSGLSTIRSSTMRSLQRSATLWHLARLFAVTSMRVSSPWTTDQYSPLNEGDFYIEWYWRQRSLQQSRHCSGDRSVLSASQRRLTTFRLPKNVVGQEVGLSMSRGQACHADILIEEFSRSYPREYDRETPVSTSFPF